jgi:hypothetical protein
VRRTPGDGRATEGFVSSTAFHGPWTSDISDGRRTGKSSVRRGPLPVLPTFSDVCDLHRRSGRWSVQRFPGRVARWRVSPGADGACAADLFRALVRGGGGNGGCRSGDVHGQPLRRFPAGQRGATSAARDPGVLITRSRQGRRVTHHGLSTAARRPHSCARRDRIPQVLPQQRSSDFAGGMTRSGRFRAGARC